MGIPFKVAKNLPCSSCFDELITQTNPLGYSRPHVGFSSHFAHLHAPFSLYNQYSYEKISPISCSDIKRARYYYTAVTAYIIFNLIDHLNKSKWLHKRQEMIIACLIRANGFRQKDQAFSLQFCVELKKNFRIGVLFHL